MEEGFFLYRVALDAADIAPRHIKSSASVVANLANPGLAIWDLATVPAGKTRTQLRSSFSYSSPSRTFS